MTNKEVASVLKETAQLIELTGGNAFRARAFSGAARTLRDLETPVTTHIEADTLTDIDGIGDGLAADLNDLYERGSFALRDDLLNAVPPGLLDVLRVKGLGTKRVRRLWEELDITSLDDLESAAQTNQIQTLSGFGAKTESNILKHVQALRRYDTQRRYADVYAPVHALRDALDQSTEAPVRIVGAFRRTCPTLKRIVLLTTADAASIQAALEEAGYDPAIDDTNAPPHVQQTVSTTLPDGFPVAIHCTTAAALGTATWYHTGSEAYRTAVMEQFGAPLPEVSSETALFEALSLPAHPPELREEVWTDALSGPLPEPLLTPSDLRGSLHNHTTYSDGAHTLEAMADAARERGLEYLGICDHSQSLTVASGLSPEAVRRQHEAIDALNSTYDGFRIFKGIESDILNDGSLDYDDEVLATFDLVVASVHSGFSMTTEEATERVIRAVSHPATTILDHPTGRLLLVREGYPIDHEAVIDACAAHNVAIELNANPYRLDLDWRWVRYAVEQGVLIAINPDAHATGELDNVRWGVAAARKGGLTPDQCLNAKSLDAFTEWLQHRTPAAASA